MADLIEISEPDDPRVADFAALRDTDLRKRYENEVGVFIAEGPNPVRELVSSRFDCKSLLVQRRRLDSIGDVLEAVDVPVYVVERALMRTIVRFRLHQGVVACGHRRPPMDPGEVAAGTRLVAVLEAMNDHENMGVIFRSARALGVDGVLLGPRSADPLYRRCVRVSMGHVLHVPWAEVATMDDALDLMGQHGIATLALTPDPAAPPLAEVAVDSPVAVLLGAEGPGLTDTVMERADLRARIPMRPEVDSLNVSVAASIAFSALWAAG